MESAGSASIICGGVLSLLMLIFHTRFYRLFGWKEDLDKITVINSRIFYTIHVALILMFLGITALSFVFADELGMCSGLAAGFDIMYAAFWLWRTAWQLCYFRPSPNPAVHYSLTVIFLLLFVSYSLPVMLKYT